MRIADESQLEQVLSQPREADREALRSLNGDLLILGAGGKMGPSLARIAKRAAADAGIRARVIAVARFSNPDLAAALRNDGIETIAADLLAPGALDRLPDCGNVIFMAARKFGTGGQEGLTWAMNTYLPGRVAERFARSRIVAFSTGNVYPLTPVAGGGSVETDPVGPVGEYAQSALGRERMFVHFSLANGTKIALLRLNYAIDLRYGILLDIGTKVFARQPVDVSMPAVNVIWQGDANSVCLRAFALANSPPFVLNVTGPETVSVRLLAHEFARRFELDPAIAGTEQPTALLNNAALCRQLFGSPSISLARMIDWVAEWIASGGPTLGKPTHFEQREGRF
ncbi:MAG: NAD-dependent epimerase/dehydratase family protein [Acidobacteriota bacterium]|nr:NAD-dependent epimerase/dehydratase family protein [Acidobacteriota bacterium]